MSAIAYFFGMFLTGSTSVILVFAQMNWIFEGIETSLSTITKFGLAIEFALRKNVSY